MVLHEFSNLQYIHTASTTLTVADMLCRKISHSTNKCPNYNTKLPPHIEVIQHKPNNALKQIHYRVKLEGVLPTRKTMMHTQIWLIMVMINIHSVCRIKVILSYTRPLIHFLFNLYHSFEQI